MYLKSCPSSEARKITMATQAEIAETTEKGTTLESLSCFFFIASRLYYYS